MKWFMHVTLDVEYTPVYIYILFEGNQKIMYIRIRKEHFPYDVHDVPYYYM